MKPYSPRKNRKLIQSCFLEIVRNFIKLLRIAYLCDSKVRNDLLERSTIGQCIWKAVSYQPGHLTERPGRLRREIKCIGKLHYLCERGIEAGQFLEEILPEK